ncbi:MAG TPA: hypothetical protein VGW31_12370 [Hanamia sp.]|nr:hypothetical protein [Hanamia sp.]
MNSSLPLIETYLTNKSERFALTVLILCAIDNRRVTLQKLISKVFDRLAKGNLQSVIEIS